MIDRQDVRFWVELPVTKAVFQLLLEHFDHQKHLLGADLGQQLDRFKGRAEVLEYIQNPITIMNLLRE